MESLQPFQPWELEAGIKLALESHRFKEWPKPAELRKWCLEARIDSQHQSRPTGADKRLPKYMLGRPTREEVTSEVRERVSYKLKVLGDWQANGNLMVKNPDGTYRYTLQDCIAEASRRQQANNETLRQRGKVA